MKKATDADNAEKYDEAMHFYEHAIDYFLHALKCKRGGHDGRGRCGGGHWVGGAGVGGWALGGGAGVEVEVDGLGGRQVGVGH